MTFVPQISSGFAATMARIPRHRLFPIGSMQTPNVTPRTTTGHRTNKFAYACMRAWSAQISCATRSLQTVRAG
ncbi:hypothetical protein ACKXGD_17620, partial [Enterococcus lactis]|uniref:hypothetical protein n=1 Tax=Enterococcus lactis TaxID=357441 RepID=UPI003907F0A6